MKWFHYINIKGLTTLWKSGWCFCCTEKRSASPSPLCYGAEVINSLCLHLPKILHTRSLPINSHQWTKRGEKNSKPSLTCPLTKVQVSMEGQFNGLSDVFY